MNYPAFKSLLIERGRHPLSIDAFEKLHQARELLYKGGNETEIQALIWEANTDILWHEQSEVVQPLFDKLSDLFSNAMSLIASFDYKVNHYGTSWKTSSRFFLFMLFRGFRLLTESKRLPEVTNLEHRWYWISKDLLRIWKKIEVDSTYVMAEVSLLSELEERKLRF